VLVALEPREIAMHLGENVVGEAIGIGGAMPPEIGRHLARQSPVDVVEGFDRTFPGV
jgi:hypothetical protein